MMLMREREREITSVLVVYCQAHNRRACRAAQHLSRDLSSLSETASTTLSGRSGPSNARLPRPSHARSYGSAPQMELPLRAPLPDSPAKQPQGTPPQPLPRLQLAFQPQSGPLLDSPSNPPAAACGRAPTRAGSLASAWCRTHTREKASPHPGASSGQRRRCRHSARSHGAAGGRPLAPAAGAQPVQQQGGVLARRRAGLWEAGPRVESAQGAGQRSQVQGSPDRRALAGPCPVPPACGMTTATHRLQGATRWALLANARQSGPDAVLHAWR